MIVEYAMLGFTINQIVPHVTRQASSGDCSKVCTLISMSCMAMSAGV